MSKGLDPEKKFEAVMEVLAKQEPLSVIARRYSMSEQTLRNAKDRFLSGAKDALQSKKEREHKNELDRLKKEISQRDQIIGEYTIVNRILKKKVDGCF